MYNKGLKVIFRGLISKYKKYDHLLRGKMNVTNRDYRSTRKMCPCEDQTLEFKDVCSFHLDNLCIFVNILIGDWLNE